MNNFNQSKNLRNPADVKIGDNSLQSLLDSHAQRLKDGKASRTNLSGADLSDVNLSGADLSRVNLNGANLTGADLSGANLGGADLIWADLSGSNLSKADLSESDLSGANLNGADLSEADLSEADLGGANLRGTYLSRADLRGANLNGVDLNHADLNGANLTNIKFDKLLNLDLYKIPNLDQKVADLVGNGDHLNMYLYHSACGTMHCRAGYAILAAEAAGRELEDEIGTSAAAALIYHASTGRVPNFYASNEDAMDDIRKCAEK